MTHPAVRDLFESLTRSQPFQRLLLLLLPA